MKVEELVRIQKDWFISVSTNILQGLLLGALPFLNTPPIPFVTEKIFKWALTKLANGLEIIGFFTFMDLRVTQQGRDYVSAKQKGYQVEINPNATAEEKRNAEEEIKRTFKPFAKFTS